MRHSTKLRMGGAFFLLFTVLTGCNELENETGKEATAETRTAPPAPVFTEADDPLRTLEMAGVMGRPATGPAMAPPPPTDGTRTDVPPPPPPRRMSHCGAEPEVTTVDVCGRSLPEKFHLAWSACVEAEQGPRGPGGPEGQEGPGGPEAPAEGAPTTTSTTSGTIHVLSSYDLSVVDSCEADVELTATHDSKFSFQKIGDKGSLTMDGTVFAKSTSPLGEKDHTLTATLNSTRVMQPTGEEAKSITESGEITVTFARGVSAPTRTVDAAIILEGAGGKTGTLTVTRVVHVSPRECRWPISGTMEKIGLDETTHTIIYGPACGQATLDGKEIDLNQRPEQPRENNESRPPRDGEKKGPPREQ